MNAVAMILLLAVALGTFAYTAVRRIRLLAVGAPDATRLDDLYVRIAGAPDHREPDLVGQGLVILAAGLALMGGLLAIPAFLTSPDPTLPFMRFNVIGILATAGGLVLLWAMKAQIKMPKYETAGIAHYLIFVGFAVLLVRTIVLVGRAFDPPFNLWVLDPDGPLPWVLLGKGYALMKDAVVAGVLLGVLVFMRFRLLDKVKRLAYGWHAWVVLGVIGTMMLADLLYDSGQVAAHAVFLTRMREMSLGDAVNHAAFSEGSPLGWIGAHMLLATGMRDIGLIDAVGKVGYWTHVTLVLAFLNYLPYGKHFHVITALPNVLTRTLDPPGRLLPMAASSEALMERVGAALELANPTDAPIGVAQIEHFTWKSLLDFYTCTECGRCSDNCPAHRTGKLLSPKHFTMDLRNHLYARADELTARPAVPPSTDDAKPTEHPAIKHVDLVPGVIDADVLWGCTTCRACEEQCPVMITYVDKIVDMRRNLVMVKGEFPHALQKTFQALETNGNPWNIAKMERAGWADGLDVPLMREHPNADVLYWVGCAASYDDKAKKIARATASILKAAGVDFAILGSEETCTGDPARRAGNELLYMMLAEQNVATLNEYKPKKIVTTCPHCFNSLLNEYPDLGGKYEVVHHTDFLLGLLVEGKITPTQGVRSKVVYHDSCYLGRYNDVYESPREILKRIPGLELVEAEWSRDKGLCCGAGGAQMWMEEQNSDRVNKRRTLQLLDTGASTIATGCPFCQTMISDGIGAFDGEPVMANREVKQEDIAVILHRALGLGAAKSVRDEAPAAVHASA